MGAELLGDVFSKMAEGAKEFGSKLLDSEPSNKAIKSGEAAIRSLGPSGDMLVDSMKGWQDATARTKGDYYSTMFRLLKGRMKEEGVSKDIKSIWDQYPNIQDTQLKNTVEYGKLRRLQMHQDLGNAGVKTGPMVEDDFPRMYPRELFEGANRESIINRMAKSGLSRRDAERLMNTISDRSRKAYNYEAPRKYDIPGYRRDLGVLFQDIERGSDRLHWAKIFGPNDENLDPILKDIRATHGISGEDLANTYIDSITHKEGMYYKGSRSWERGLASMNMIANLSLAFISHAAQSVNIPVYGGRLTPMFDAFGDMIKELYQSGSISGAKDFALRAGSTLTEAAHQMHSMYGEELGNIGSKFMQKTPFPYMIELNRTIASVAGKHLAQDLFDDINSGVRTEFNKRSLASLGVDVDEALKRGSLNEDDLLQAAKRMNDQTMFTFDANQLPMGWRSSPGARVLMQFKQFAFSQANFVKNFAVKPALDYVRTAGREGDLKPLVYMSLLFPSFGEAVADIQSIVRKGTLSDRPKDLSARLMNDMLYAGGFGIYRDLIFSLTSPSESPIWHFVAGPSIEKAVTASRAISHEITGLPKSVQPIGPQILGSVPFVGPQLRYRLQQYERSKTKVVKSKGREYYRRGTTKQPQRSWLDQVLS